MKVLDVNTFVFVGLKQFDKLKDALRFVLPDKCFVLFVCHQHTIDGKKTHYSIFFNYEFKKETEVYIISKLISN